jgi:extracellular elastinolytic metalloproteinase
MQTAPSMVDARNAILAADQARFGGADQAEIWAAFARRGLGRFASQTNGSGRTAGVESDTNPLPDFEAPGQANANVVPHGGIASDRSCPLSTCSTAV